MRSTFTSGQTGTSPTEAAAEGIIDTAKARARGSVIEPASTPTSDRTLTLNRNRAITPTVSGGTSTMSAP